MSICKPYISIEGIKGSGKTCVAESLQHEMERLGIAVERLNTTQPIKSISLSEWLQRNFSFLKRFDWFNEWLYAKRANWHCSRLQGSGDLVLGDRSIVTSYATRWQKWGSHLECIRNVDSREGRVPVPDFVIWLYCEPEKAFERIKRRPKRNYGRHDETIKRLHENHAAYFDIFASNEVSRLKNTKWLLVNGDQSLKECVELILQFINTEVIKTEKTNYDYK